MKMQQLLFLTVVVSQCGAVAKPVQSTSLEEAISKAPIVLLAESGLQQFDDMKEGEEVTTDSMAFDCRKQAFKILKVYRNQSQRKFPLNSTIEVNAKSNGCIVFKISVKKERGKLIITQQHKGRTKTYSVPINQNHEKGILFLSAGEKIPEHYGWFVSPQKFSEELGKKLATTDSGKRTVHMAEGCD